MNKDYYDFQLKFSVFIEEGQTFGIAFRFKDPFNYYVFEMSQEDKGFKRFRKFIKGEPNDIQKIVDGGFIPKTWYNFKILAKQNHIVIYFTDKQVDLERAYQEIFSVYDNEHVHGTIAFTANNLESSFIDNISIQSLECTIFNEQSRENMVILTPTAPRYIEDYKNGFFTRWKVYDPIDSVDGPSLWQTENNIDGRATTCAQESKIYGNSEFEDVTGLVLNDPEKSVIKGQIFVKAKPLDSGMISMIFRWNNDGEFYILEVAGGDHKFVRIRKKKNRIYTLIGMNPQLGYKPGEWIKIVVTLNKDKMNALISEDFYQNKMVQVFSKDLVDNDFKTGLVGISTYKTRAYFDEIGMSPFNNKNDKDEVIYVDEKHLNRYKII